MNRPTPETDAARHDLSDYGPPVLCSWGDWVAADFACKLERERDEARDALEEEKKWHHRTHKELIEAQCKLLDIEYDKLKS
jgi:hypothetical protein